MKPLVAILVFSFAPVNPIRNILNTLARERSRVSSWVPVAIATGIVIYFSLADEPSLATLLAAPVLALAAWALRNRFWLAAIAFFTLTLVSLGFSAAQLETISNENPMLDRALSMQPVFGRVAQTDIMPDGIRLTLSHPRIGDIRPENAPENIRVKFAELAFEDAPPTGADVSFSAALSPLSEPVAPRATDFRRQAYFKHLGAMGWSRDVIEIVDPSPQNVPWNEAFSLAIERTRKTLARHVYDRLPDDVAAMTAARLNGEQTGISSPVMDAMRTAGLIHLLATSGVNVTIMGLLIYFPLRAFFALIPWIALRFPIKKWAAAGAVFSAMGYTFLVGSQAATFRALVMTALAMLAITVDRRATPMRLALVSASIALLIMPSAAIGPSFQMSFAAVFCLIAFHKDGWKLPLREYLNFLPQRLATAAIYSIEIVRTSLIATAATTPFTVYHFQTFSLYGFIANVAAIPLTSFWIMPAILMAYLTAPFELDGPFIYAAGLGDALTIRIAKTVAAWPYALVHWPAMPDFSLIAIVLGGLWLCLWKERWRYFGLLPVLAGMFYPLYTTSFDFFVSPSGKAWAALLDDGRLAVSSARREKFAVRQWRERLGNVVIIESKALPEDFSQLSCDPQGCVYRKEKIVVAMPITESATLEDCEHADIVVAPFSIAPCAAAVIDRTALDTHGAHAIRFANGKAHTVVARHGKGKRPWSPAQTPPKMPDTNDEPQPTTP